MKGSLYAHPAHPLLRERMKYFLVNVLGAGLLGSARDYQQFHLEFLVDIAPVPMLLFSFFG